MSGQWKEEYVKVIEEYLKDENEFSLYSASLLGKELIEQGVSPDEVIEAHMIMFKKIVQERNYTEWIPYIYKSFNLLIELMTVYGITYQEHIELKEQLKSNLATQVAYKRLKFYVDEMEFVTKRLASMNEELDQRVIELSSLQKISRAINSVLELDQLFDSISASLDEIVQYDSCSIMLMERDKKLHFKKALRKDLQPFSDDQVEFHTFAAEIVLKKRDACLVRDTNEENLFSGNNSSARSLLGVPMLVGNEILGVITLDKATPDSFTDNTSRLLSIVASQAAIAIKNATNFEEVKKISITDGLTGLYNHQYFYDRLKTEIDWARHYNLPVSFLMLDIDSFKEYNDNFGHTAGDAVIKMIAKELQRCTREDDVVARYGGEEFAVILVSVDSNIAGKIAERIRKSIMEQSVKEENGFNRMVTVSIGVASFPQQAQTSKELVDCADKALYDSKKKGRNRVTFFNTGANLKDLETL